MQQVATIVFKIDVFIQLSMTPSAFTDAKDLSEPQRRLVKQWRHQVQIDLMNYMNDKQYCHPGRFGDLLLMLPDLRMITQMMVQQVSFAKLTGFAQIDDLLQEMLLAGE